MATERFDAGALFAEFIWNFAVSTLLGLEFKSLGLGLVSLTALAGIDRIARRVVRGA